MPREALLPQDRIRWAIRHSGRRLQELAAAIGCTHAALSFWQNGRSDVRKIRAGLLLDFCRETGANVHWVLTGDGPRLAPEAAAEASATPLLEAATHIAHDAAPEVVAAAELVLRALAPAARYGAAPPAEPATAKPAR